MKYIVYIVLIVFGLSSNVGAQNPEIPRWVTEFLREQEGVSGADYVTHNVCHSDYYYEVIVYTNYVVVNQLGYCDCENLCWGVQEYQPISNNNRGVWEKFQSQTDLSQFQNGRHIGYVCYFGYYYEIDWFISDQTIFTVLSVKNLGPCPDGEA